MNSLIPEDPVSLVLAAEDCAPSEFEALHVFTPADDNTLSKLVAHGPVLLRGGRGTGKSALMIEAARRLAPESKESTGWGVYISLRHLELLRSRGDAYEKFLCSLIIRQLEETVESFSSEGLDPSVPTLQRALTGIYSETGKRIVLFFDDAAHIGREASLQEFFDIFRTISSSVVSCKAAIYPGVTKFGSRFDVYNDATVVDVSRNEELPGYPEIFSSIISARYPTVPDTCFSGVLSKIAIGGILAQSVLGNMRAFVFACNLLFESAGNKPIGLPAIQQTMLSLSSNYFWPLLDELRPKLGMYEPLIEPAQRIATVLYEHAAQSGSRKSVLVHRDVVERLAKLFEILEYVGFISRREASRAMKSGGRGARYALNLCALLEQVPGARLTQELYAQWASPDKLEPVQFHKTGSHFSEFKLPDLSAEKDLGIFQLSISYLGKSKAYPYGLTEAKMQILEEAGFSTIGELAEASDGRLLALPSVGQATLQRFRNVLGQAVWM